MSFRRGFASHHVTRNRVPSRHRRRGRPLVLERLEQRAQPGALLISLDFDLTPAGDVDVVLDDVFDLTAEADPDTTHEVNSNTQSLDRTGEDPIATLATTIVFAEAETSNVPTVIAMGGGRGGGGGGGKKPPKITNYEFDSADHYNHIDDTANAVTGGPYTDVTMRDSPIGPGEHDLLNVTGEMTLSLPSQVGGGTFNCGPATHKFVVNVITSSDNTREVIGDGDIYNMDPGTMNSDGSSRLWDCTVGKGKKINGWLVEWPNIVTVKRLDFGENLNGLSGWTFKTDPDPQKPNAYFTQIVNGKYNFVYDNQEGKTCEVEQRWQRCHPDPNSDPDDSVVSSQALFPAPIALVACEFGVASATDGGP